MIFDDVMFFVDLAKWGLLIYMAYWLYSWTREKLGFSPLLTLVVAVTLIYYLVIEHPILGALGIFGWVILTSGLLMILGMVPGFFYMFKYRH